MIALSGSFEDPAEEEGVDVEREENHDEGDAEEGFLKNFFTLIPVYLTVKIGSPRTLRVKDLMIFLVGIIKLLN